jgi:hypothetical protein
MSKDAIRAVIEELELLPDSEQHLVLTFLAKLRLSRMAAKSPPPGGKSALQAQDGLLVFTGQLEETETDWVRLVRQERDDELMNAAMKRPAHS